MIFFVNSKVNNDHLIESHFRQTTDRINNNNDNLLLVTQDSTYLNFINHKAKIDIGIVNSGEFGDVVTRRSPIIYRLRSSSSR
ncbi:hypothetical protein [Candidatus Tisiphia endosymbiont of Ptychoptera albimana]|uniref:hypothetical protein n=1 Tax=Candidatus Tisiphia endosymbiont of Ptychoptera albimana TaxID=3066260 RepID=UPI00312C82CE